MKILSETQRLKRYRSVLGVLLSKDSFEKPDIYDRLKEEHKAFIGRVINELVKDGFLTKKGSNAKPRYGWSKKKETFNTGRWMDQRVYSATVKSSPSSDRPRERLLFLGPAKLKTSELLAILIRSGLQGESAIQAGEKLAARFGSDLESLSLKARGELKVISKAMGESAYCQIMAALELGKRMAGQQAFESAQNHRIRSTADALTFCRQHFSRLAREAEQEEFHVVLLDQNHRVIRTEKITVGLSDRSLAHPREVFRPAIRESASALILVHNHPNGNPSPSEDDVEITRELKRGAETLGLRILDHIILGKNEILSMVERNLL